MRDHDRDELGDSMLKLPPHSLEAEQSVIGGLMLANDAIDRIEGRVSEPDFWADKNRKLFSVIRGLLMNGGAADPVTVAERMQATGDLEYVGGLAYIGACYQNIASAANLEHWADIIRDKAVRRKLITFGGDIAEAAFMHDPRPATEILAEVQRKVSEIAEGYDPGDSPRSLSELLTGLMSDLETRHDRSADLQGLSTGIQDLDEKLQGLKGGELVIIGGRPSMGKTTLAMGIAAIAANRKIDPVPALVFSMEMRPKALAESLLANVGRIDAWKLRTGKLQTTDWADISTVLGTISVMPLFIDGSPRVTVERILSRARQQKRKTGLGLIVVDYLQLMEGAGDNRNDQVSTISRGLKLLANELDVPVVVLAQLNRGCEARTNKRPMMSDLRDSGAIEADADVVLFVYRDEVYTPDKEETKGKAEIIVAKQREGEIGTVYAAFVGHHKRFDNTDWRPVFASPDKPRRRGADAEL